MLEFKFLYVNNCYYWMDEYQIIIKQIYLE